MGIMGIMGIIKDGGMGLRGHRVRGSWGTWQMVAWGVCTPSDE